ncbi:MFS transporter [Ralstonia mannitolilytica]|uniref:D-galactarate permease n=1 Tax=Ralstonia mannitolilytica TaxID=105219 RepID=A0AAJ4ZQC0_9RALS|nr:MFS transporter [Ralstonia mannitolilytica]CAG2132772.1 putative sulfoacetate transporter SauU [Ralstonia mannitolilytica]CAJ0727439.1 putative sulfoacetate transporter SauU [Ralstonia mannitolilytica]SUE25241.1 D-galactarate permease [Ralstonia mannitolilytica]SUE26051.1 D-galactarate permease [Ralstonia mannitolilytica]SUE35861.1 D-galactarate permease [Ralstonia mannitolilytica]
MNSNAQRWLGVITLFLVVAISYVDRINIAVLITQHDFLQHMGIAANDRSSQGLLATAFMAGYGLSAIVFTPFCAALFGVRRSLIYGLTLWGVITIASPWFHSYMELLASRFILGFAEGPLFSLGASYIKAHFDSEESGKPNAIFNMGTGIGLAVGYPLVGYAIASADWESSFHLLGLCNLVLGIPLVLAFVRMPARYAALPRPESLPAALSTVGDMFRGAFHTRHIFTMTVLTAAFLAYLWGSSNWLPTYLKEARGFSLREMGWMASMPQYAAVLGVLLGGLLLDVIPRRRVPLVFVLGSLGVAVAVLLAINSTDRYAAAYWLTAASLFWGLQSPAIPSTVQFNAAPQHVACAFGVVNGVGSLVAGFMPAVMGVVIGLGSGGGLAAGFGSLVGTQLIVLLCGLALLRGGAQAAPAVPGAVHPVTGK